MSKQGMFLCCSDKYPKKAKNDSAPRDGIQEQDVLVQQPGQGWLFQKKNNFYSSIHSGDSRE